MIRMNRKEKNQGERAKREKQEEDVEVEERRLNGQNVKQVQ